MKHRSTRKHCQVLPAETASTQTNRHQINENMEEERQSRLSRNTSGDKGVAMHARQQANMVWLTIKNTFCSSCLCITIRPYPVLHILQFCTY